MTICHCPTPSELPERVRRPALASLPLLAALCTSLPAHALTITATFGSGLDVIAQATINSAINFYETTFSDPVSIAIKFDTMTSGLGQNSTFYTDVSYGSYMTALRNDATSATDGVAMASVPTGTHDPVLDQTKIAVTRAQLQAVGLGYLMAAPAPGSFDSTISLNMGSINTGQFSLTSTVEHEINEALGAASNVGESMIRPVDLFRYSASGARSFMTSSAATSYFSIDSGVTDLAGYNQNPSGDYGDFDSASIRVQNAFATPGQWAVMTAGSVEVTMLDAVGYTLAPVPEPETAALMFAGLGMLTWIGRRRRT